MQLFKAPVLLAAVTVMPWLEAQGCQELDCKCAPQPIAEGIQQDKAEELKKAFEWYE